MESIVDGNNVSSPVEADIEVSSKGLQERFDEENTELEESAAAPNDSEAQEQDVVEGESEKATATTSSAARGSGKGKGRGGRGSAAGGTSTRGKAANAGGSKGAGGGRGGRGGAASARGGGAAKRGKGATSTTSKSGRGGASKSAAGGSRASNVSTNGKDTNAEVGIGGTGSGSASASGPLGTVFPLARISRIVKVDKEIEMTSKDAIWTISAATEMFIKHLTDSAYAKARLEKKRTITYKELASAVESQNEFFFLQDVIPQPISLTRALQMRQEVEDKIHMREAGLLEDDDEDEGGDLDTAPLLNQTIGDETADSLAGRGKLSSKKEDDEEADEDGDIEMEGEQPSMLTMNGSASMSNGHREDIDLVEDPMSP